MIKRALVALVACMALAVVAAACGGGGDTTGGGDSTEASGSAPTKAAFIHQADKICGEAEERLNEEVAEYAEEKNIPIEKEEPTQAQQVEIYAAVVLPNVAQQGEELAALTPPEGDEKTIEEITDALASGVEEAEADPKQLTEGKNPLADASKQARAYGMKSCGNE